MDYFKLFALIQNQDFIEKTFAELKGDCIKVIDDEVNIGRDRAETIVNRCVEAVTKSIKEKGII